MKLSMPKALIATESEYGANLTGLNTFFGAVLGFVIAETDRLDAGEFAYVLFMVSGVVISIHYVHASSQKIAYSVLTFVLIAALPYFVSSVLDEGRGLPDQAAAGTVRLGAAIGGGRIFPAPTRRSSGYGLAGPRPARELVLSPHSVQSGH